MDPDSDIVEMVSVTMTRENMRDLLVVIAINTTTLDMVIDTYRDKMDPIDLLGLENAFDFGTSMIDTLTVICGVTNDELKEDVKSFINTASRPHMDGVQIHMNKSGDHVDDMVKLVFKNHGT